MAQIVEQFMAENPDIEIQMTGNEVSQHLTKMKLAAMNDSLPDILWLEQPVAKDMAAAGYLYDLMDEAQKRGITDRLLDGMKDAAVVEGKRYGLPSEIMMSGLFYNKALFAKYDVKAPETFEELLKAVDTFNANGIVPISNGAKSNFSVWSFQGMLTRYGFFDKLDDLNSGKLSFVNDDFIHFYEKIQELRERKAFSANITTLDYFQAIDQFLGGNAAMVDSGAWEVAKFEESGMAQDIGFLFGPTFSDGVGDQKTGIKTSGGVYSVSAKVANDPEKLDAIMKFFEFYYGDPGTKIIAEKTFNLPTTKYTGTIDADTHPVLAELLTALNDEEWKSSKEPFSYLATHVGNSLFDSIWGVINGVYTPEQAAQVVKDAMMLERAKGQ
ncbi:ABC transporter substrate-binding protein [Paenibacillaceae bacterium WGS1546]|uniref:ABC transporter substrate-binding protein n=1 Tax=Cohnella sp. WGS1546 TaxID=3366810 RepID=UPI00372D1F74